MMRGNGGTTNVQQIVDSSGNWYIDQYSAATVGFKIGGVDKLMVSNTAGNGAAITAGTAATAVSPLAITQTINNAAIVFPGITYNVTATALGASGSKLLDLKVGGVSQISFQSYYLDGGASGITGADNFRLNGLTGLDLAVGGTTYTRITNSYANASTVVFGWSASGPGFSNTVGISYVASGVIGVGTGAAGSFAGRLKLTSTIVAATTVATLNASPTVGEISTVNDALAVTAKGATVAAGGSAVSVVVWNGANWVGI